MPLSPFVNSDEPIPSIMDDFPGWRITSDILNIVKIYQVNPVGVEPT